MQDEKILTTIAGANPTSRLEVASCTDAQGNRRVELRRLSWGEGIGWYCQQTLRLDPSETENLVWALKGGRRTWSDRPLSFPGKVIPFPVPPADDGEPHVCSLRRGHKKRTGGSSPESPVAEKRRTKQEKEKSATLHA